MNVEITETERHALLSLIRSQCDSLRTQIHHSDTPSFTDELKRDREVLLNLILKLKVTAAAA